MKSGQLTLNVKGKGEAKTIFDSEHPYNIYKIEREQGESKTLVGYTTSQYECLVCQKLEMQWSFHGSYPSTEHLQNAKDRITEIVEMEFKKKRVNPNLPLKAESDVFWITRGGVVDKGGDRNMKTVLTLGLASTIYVELLKYINNSLAEGKQKMEDFSAFEAKVHAMEQLLQQAPSEEHTAGQDRTFITETDKAAMIFMLTLTATLQAAGLGDGVMDGLPFADADQTSQHSASEVSEDA